MWAFLAVPRAFGPLISHKYCAYRGLVGNIGIYHVRVLWCLFRVEERLWRSRKALNPKPKPMQAELEELVHRHESDVPPGRRGL